MLDTHALLWWRSVPRKLGRGARRACERADCLGICAISFWEVGMLAARGRIRLRIPLTEWVGEVMQGPRIEPLDVTPEIAVVAAGLGIHGDPADRLIAATALHHHCALVTHDDAITSARIVQTIWD